MTKILMLQGLPASGKSTYAKELARTKGYIRVNKDDLRAMLNDGKYTGKNEKRVLKIEQIIVEEALTSGRNVVIDNTNFNPIHKQKYLTIAKKHNAELEVKFFDTPLEECIERDKKRANSVGESVIRKMHKQYLAKKETYEPPVGAPKAIIVDIDGTLAHMTDRSPYDWSRVGEDEVDKTILRLVNTLFLNNLEVIVISGRDDVCRQETTKWLRDNGVSFNKLFMRANLDSRKDNVVKREIFEREIKSNYRVEFVLDDRNQVVEMWRSLGLKCLQVEDGDF
jgi:polynucleotide kinase